MRSSQRNQKAPNWFRIENAHVDSENATSETTKVFIYDVIGDSWWEDSTPANEFVKQISNIHTPKIELHLNSPGGDIFDGVAIYNALKAHPAEVTVVVDALAASAASFIAQAGDKVIMTKAATMMIHDGSAMAWGPASVMRDTADLLDKLSNTVAEIYSDRAGQNVEFWRNLMIEETWYNSHEAVAAGLADEIGEDTKEEDDNKAQNAWDMSIFNYAGRNGAPSPHEVRLRIANRLKENTVADKPTNSGDPAASEENPAPVTDPEAPTTEGQRGDAEEERQDETQPASPEVDGGQPAAPSSEPAPTGEPSNRFTFTVNGQQTTDMTVVQNRLNFLETFRNESMTSARKQFVNDLAKGNKILATQMESMEKYALSLNDEQYDAWKATWDGAASNALFAPQPGGSTNHDGPQSQAKVDAADQLEIYRDTVMHHKRSGMNDEQIKATDSYKNLIALDPEFKL